MIDSYSVKNFKIHQDGIDIEFPGVTILTGTNNSGKTSLIQSIRTLAAVENTSEGIPFLPFQKIEGLGELRDVLNKNVSRSESIQYSLHFRDMTLQLNVHFVLSFNSNLDGLLTVAADTVDMAVLDRIRMVIVEDESECVSYEFIRKDTQYCYEYDETDNKKNQGYVKFSRLMPQTYFMEIPSQHQRECLMNCFRMLNNLTNLSVKYLGPYRQVSSAMRETGNSLLDMYGSNVSEVIDRWKDRTVFDGLNFAEAFAKWTGELLHTKFVVRVENGQYRLLAVENEIEFGLGQIGFGNTQILPIIVQILTAQPGDLVIIENPEVHLHPRWKADLMKLFFHAAAYGVKVIIETQSMEMIIRTRLMVKCQEELRNKIALYFFEKREFACEINKIDIKETGELDIWPDDFLDRVTIDDSFGLL